MAVTGIAWFSLEFVLRGEVGELIFTVLKVFLILIALWSEVLVSRELVRSNFTVILHAVNWPREFLPS